MATPKSSPYDILLYIIDGLPNERLKKIVNFHLCDSIVVIDQKSDAKALVKEHGRPVVKIGIDFLIKYAKWDQKYMAHILLHELLHIAIGINPKVYLPDRFLNFSSEILRVLAESEVHRLSWLHLGREYRLLDKDIFVHGIDASFNYVWYSTGYFKTDDKWLFHDRISEKIFNEGFTREEMVILIGSWLISQPNKEKKGYGSLEGYGSLGDSGSLEGSGIQIELHESQDCTLDELLSVNDAVKSINTIKTLPFDEKIGGAASGNLTFIGEISQNSQYRFDVKDTESLALFCSGYFNLVSKYKHEDESSWVVFLDVSGSQSEWYPYIRNMLFALSRTYTSSVIIFGDSLYKPMSIMGVVREIDRIGFSWFVQSTRVGSGTNFNNVADYINNNYIKNVIIITDNEGSLDHLNERNLILNDFNIILLFTSSLQGKEVFNDSWNKAHGFYPKSGSVSRTKKYSPQYRYRYGWIRAVNQVFFIEKDEK